MTTPVPQDEVKRRLNDVAHAINERLPEGYCFACIVMPSGENVTADYVSNMKREHAVKALKEILFRWGVAEDWMKDVQ